MCYGVILYMYKENTVLLTFNVVNTIDIFGIETRVVDSRLYIILGFYCLFSLSINFCMSSVSRG